MKGLHFSILQSILNRLAVYYRVNVEDISVPRSSQESDVICTSFCQGLQHVPQWWGLDELTGTATCKASRERFPVTRYDAVHHKISLSNASIPNKVSASFSCGKM